MSISQFAAIWKDETFGNLNEISYLQVSWLSSRVQKKKRYHCMIFEANCVGKLERLGLCGELCEIIDEPMFLMSQEAKSALTIG